MKALTLMIVIAIFVMIFSFAFAQGQVPPMNNLPFQFSIVGGTPKNPTGGLCVGTYGASTTVYLYNRNQPGIYRTSLNFFSLYSIGTDEQANGTKDFYIRNHGTGKAVLTMDKEDRLKLNCSELGFYGAPATVRPVVTGNWSDGTAQRSLLAAMVKVGLVVDQTN